MPFLGKLKIMVPKGKDRRPSLGKLKIMVPKGKDRRPSLGKLKIMVPKGKDRSQLNSSSDIVDGLPVTTLILRPSEALMQGDRVMNIDSFKVPSRLNGIQLKIRDLEVFYQSDL